MSHTKLAKHGLAGMTVGGVFSGIGGLELGFARAGFCSSFLCDVDADACSVLEARFSGVKLHVGIDKLSPLPAVDVLVGGFPCQDLSAVGTRRGITGDRSSIIHKLFDLLEVAARKPEWLVLENVPFMLQLQGGMAIDLIARRLEGLGFSWAYRVVDSRAFGLPQRRRRVFIVATRGSGSPQRVLFADNAAPKPPLLNNMLARGFYWTEGNTGVGWAVDAIPTLKGGSALSIPSPPAIWSPSDGRIHLPDIRDAERLQGFDEDWTAPTERKNSGHGRRRWRQIGNAVSVPVAHWIASRILVPGDFDGKTLSNLELEAKWPYAACGSPRGERFRCNIGEWPFTGETPHLHEFLRHRGSPISRRAIDGFFQRVRRSSLRLEEGFLEALAVAAGFDRSEATRIHRGKRIHVATAN